MPQQDQTRHSPFRIALRILVWAVFLVIAVKAGQATRQFLITDSRFALPGSPLEWERNPEFAIRGAVHASRSKIAQVFEKDFGRSIFRLPIAERRRRLLAVDWVEDASVSRLWPNRVVVRIHERRPVAFVNITERRGSRVVSRIALIDAEGVLLDAPRQSNFTFPVLLGVSEDQDEEERRSRVQLMRRLLNELGTLAKDVSEIDLSATNDLKITVPADGHALELWLGDRNFASRVQNFWNHYPEIRRRSGTVTRFDLRLDDRITAKE